MSTEHLKLPLCQTLVFFKQIVPKLGKHERRDVLKDEARTITKLVDSTFWFFLKN